MASLEDAAFLARDIYAFLLQELGEQLKARGRALRLFFQSDGQKQSARPAFLADSSSMVSSSSSWLHPELHSHGKALLH